MAQRHSLSMPYWCVGNPVGDPFGPGVMDRTTPLENTDILCNARKKGLIEFTSAHDDDLVDWDPHNSADDLDPGSETSRTLKAIKEELDRAALKFHTMGCSLHGDPVFRNGGLANPDPRIRILAAQKTLRSLRIGSFLGARYFTYWVARDGFETQFSVPWDRAFSFIIEGLNLARRYAAEEKLSFRGMTIEHKPNEPRGEMFLPTIGHSLALIERLEDPDFWGVNPEVLQHDQMAGLTSVAAVAFALSMGKLFFIHLGNQKPNQFDNDNPPMIGMDGVKELVSIMYLLDRAGWNGVVEFDNHMLRTDTAPGEENRIVLRERFVELAVEACRALERKGAEIASDPAIAKLQEKIWARHEDLSRMLGSGDIKGVLGTAVDYGSVARAPVEIGRLDLEVDRILLGL